MSSTLELLCGSSGVGKTSSIDIIIKSYRWTTRSKRSDEIDSREFDGTKTTHGFFVSEKEFLNRHLKDPFVGFHRYPDSNIGDLYGFNLHQINDSLEKNQKLSEQVASFEAIASINKYFPLTKKLFLTFDNELKRRALMKNDVYRYTRISSDLQKFQKNWNSFEDIFFDYFDNTYSNFVLKGTVENMINHLCKLFLYVREHKSYAISKRNKEKRLLYVFFKRDLDKIPKGKSIEKGVLEYFKNELKKKMNTM